MTLESPEGAVRADIVLVVDDEADIRDSVAQILEAALSDVEVVLASEAMEALRCVEAGGIDLIITDYRMPGMDGLAFLEQAAKIAPDVPRILMTAFGDLDVALEAINQAHVHSFFPKPFEPDEVTDVVWKVLDERWERVQTNERASKSLKSLQKHDDGDHESEHEKGGHSRR